LKITTTQSLVLSLTCGAALLATGQASATLVVQDFNDAAAGNLSGQSGIGTGAGAAWAGSSSLDVVAGDLTPIASTNYAITQAGTAQSVTHDAQFNTSARKSTVALDTALTGSEIWVSFLVNQNGQSGGRVGVLFNQSNTSAGASPTNPRLFAIGDNIEAWMAADNEIEVIDTFNEAFDNTVLVLAKIDYNPVGDETLSVWVDPDVTALGAADGTVVSDWLDSDGITSVSVQTYVGGGSQGDPTPFIDSVRLSDGSNAYQDVTGVVPEPTSLALLAFGATLVGSRRRR